MNNLYNDLIIIHNVRTYEPAEFRDKFETLFHKYKNKHNTNDYFYDRDNMLNLNKFNIRFGDVWFEFAHGVYDISITFRKNIITMIFNDRSQQEYFTMMLHSIDKDFDCSDSVIKYKHEKEFDTVYNTLYGFFHYYLEFDVLPLSKNVKSARNK